MHSTMIINNQIRNRTRWFGISRLKWPKRPISMMQFNWALNGSSSCKSKYKISEIGKYSKTWRIIIRINPSKLMHFKTKKIKSSRKSLSLTTIVPKKCNRNRINRMNWLGKKWKKVGSLGSISCFSKCFRLWAILVWLKRKRLIRYTRWK